VTTAVELLGPGGALSRALSGYEVRDGQLGMAAAVERALRQERVLFCEAGTGTGKTFAYLVPAILSGKKVVIATATRALQEQIAVKDLPFIQRALGLKPRVAVMKGLANYVCLRRHHEFLRSPESLRPAHTRALEAVRAWVGQSETGDVSELAGIGEDDPIFSHITSSSDTRIGPSCHYYQDCFVTRMKREAEAAQLVIVNHHLFFADLALRGPHPGRVLPDYDAVIFDEAHQLEDVATAFFGVRVSKSRIERLLRDLERGLRIAGRADALWSRTSDGQLGAPALLDEVRAASEALFVELTRSAQGDDPRATLERQLWVGPVLSCHHRLDAALEGIAALSRSTAGSLSNTAHVAASSVPPGLLAEALELAARRADAVRDDIATIVEGAPGRVAWLDAGERGPALSSSPVDVSALFRQRIFETIPAVVVTSATLSAGAGNSGRPASEARADGKGSDFRYLRQRFGLLEGTVAVDELIVGSPFDFERRALLYAPRDLPLPGDRAFAESAVARIAELVEITDGGCFVLTTSLRSMRAIHRGLVERLPGRRIALQGQAPKSSLIAGFRAAGDGILVATTSFWEGVDVPGRALRLVVLEKVPFAVPTDPLFRARAEALEADGHNAFLELMMPAAAIALKQGFGRLIRTRSDAGIVALLDVRVHRKSYGRKLLQALPAAARAFELAEVQRFWEGLEAPSAEAIA
jgi:ATP-dependent DNA helicase DinG